jgi:hypothetical protein
VSVNSLAAARMAWRLGDAIGFGSRADNEIHVCCDPDAKIYALRDLFLVALVFAL